MHVMLIMTLLQICAGASALAAAGYSMIPGLPYLASLPGHLLNLSLGLTRLGLAWIWSHVFRSLATFFVAYILLQHAKSTVDDLQEVWSTASKRRSLKRLIKEEGLGSRSTW